MALEIIGMIPRGKNEYRRTGTTMKKIVNKIKAFKVSDPYYTNYALSTQTLVGGGTIQLLVELARDHLSEEDTYLEIGCYQAWNFSLISHFANSKCVAVDNFSQDFEENKRYKLPTRELVLRNISTIGRAKGNLIEGDFREVLKSDKIKKRSVKLYFYDGPHEYQDQVDGVEMALPLLQDQAIIFVDDWGSENVKKSTQILLNKYKELELIRVLDGPRNRAHFNQGQVAISYSREKNES